MGIEIERKFLVKTLPQPLPQPLEICQGYICDHPDRVVRVRTIGTRAFLTVKGKTLANERLEFEYPIPLAHARELLDRICLKPLVEKGRYTLYFQEFEWTIDVFSGVNQGLVLAEIELADPDQSFPLPPWIGQEVSQDPRYFNSNLIAHPFTAWPG